MTRFISTVLILFSLSFLTSCNDKPKTSTSTKTNTSTTSNSNNSSTNNTNNSTPTSDYQSPMSALAQTLKECNKVEYLMYDFGITFETPSAAEVARFYGFIDDKPADESKCTKNKYDGSVVFKNEEGDIKLGMEFNVLKGCHRVVFQLDGKTYTQQFNDKGLKFFDQILNMQKKQMQGMQGGN